MESNEVNTKNWREEVNPKGPPLRILKDQSKTVTFLDEGVRSMGNKYGTNDKIVPQVEFQVQDEEDKLKYTFYVKLMTQSGQHALNEITNAGLPLAGKKAKITRNGEGMKTRYSILF